jgi:hypothetical protein
VSGKLKQFLKKPPAEDAPSTKSIIDCTVNGCPLPGVHGVGPGRSICCVHDGEDPSRWPEQTGRIKNRLRLFHAVLDMTNAPPNMSVPPALVDRFVDAGLPEPLPQRDLHGIKGRQVPTARSYGAQLKRELIVACRGPREAPANDRQARDAGHDGWLTGLVKSLTHSERKGGDRYGEVESTAREG